MRVLHLIDQSGNQTHPATLALMAQSVGRLGHVDQHVALLGTPALRDEANAAGLTDVTLLRAPYGRAMAALPALRRMPADLVHCWSVEAFTLAALRYHRKPRLLTLTQHVSKRTVHWLRMTCSESPGRAAILTTSATLRRTLLSGGVPEKAVHVVRPGLDFGAVSHGTRKALRESWNVDDQTRVGVMLADPPTQTDAAFGLRALMLACDANGAAFRLLLHPDQYRRPLARQLARGLGRDDWLIDSFDVASPWRVLPACDFALAVGPMAGNLGLLWAMAANVPIIGDATYAVSEIVEDRHSALLAKPDPSPRGVAHRVVQLFDDAQLAWQIKDAARSEAYSFFSRKNYCAGLEMVYNQLAAGEAIDVPPLESTGGLRFTGRA